MSKSAHPIAPGEGRAAPFARFISKSDIGKLVESLGAVLLNQRRECVKVAENKG